MPVNKKPKRLAAFRADPFRSREERKYANPIPSRELILATIEEQGAPCSMHYLAQLLGLAEEQDLVALERRLGAMVRDGQLLQNRRHDFCLVNQQDLIPGRVLSHHDGFGFLHPDNGGDDLFLSPKQMRLVFHGDRVVVRLSGQDSQGRREGAIVEILERNTKRIVGHLTQEAGVGFVVSNNKRINHDVLIPSDRFAGAKEGQIVVAEITDQPTKRTMPIGCIVEVLGDENAPGMHTDITIQSYGISTVWPDAVLEEIKDWGRDVPAEAFADRTDLRKYALVTIDGADARDFDDAVWCEPKANGWRLLVCIADVSHYVHAGSALDQEAQSRGTSVYFPHRVIPMLPEVLSNGLCSLNPQVDRLCMTADISLDASGAITRCRFYPAVMKSQARLTYDEVAAMLVDGDASLCAKYATVLPHLQHLYQLYQVLHQKRVARGAIEFDTVEPSFVINDAGQIESIHPLIRNDAHRLIEECMLLANVAAAQFFIKRRIPGIYRVHDAPRAQKLADLQEFLGRIGLSLPNSEPTPADYAHILEQIHDRPDARLIQTILLRSMQQAVYSAENRGHFGLAFSAYTHFTSPIRRYPDLIVHRLIKQALNKGEGDFVEYSSQELQLIADISSNAEHRADDASRDEEGWLKCEFMQSRIGDIFTGTITRVTSFGVFVELDDIFVDGLVHVTSLENDFYHYDPIGQMLTGQRHGQVFQLGDRMKIQVAAVNIDERKIDFIPVNQGLKQSRKNKRAPTSKLTSAGSKGAQTSSSRRAAVKSTGKTTSTAHPSSKRAKGEIQHAKKTTSKTTQHAKKR